MAGSRTGDVKINFDSNITSVTIMDTSGGSDSPFTWTSSGQTKSYEFNPNQTYTATVSFVSGYKLSTVTATDSKISIGNITDNGFTVTITLSAVLYELNLASKSTAIKIVNSDNLARFKQKCDETYTLQEAGGGGGGNTGYTVTKSGVLVNSETFICEHADGTITELSSQSSASAQNVVKVYITADTPPGPYVTTANAKKLVYYSSGAQFLFIYSIVGACTFSYSPGGGGGDA